MKDKIKKILKTIIQFIVNPRLLLCFGIAWLITNGWSYILLGIGTFLEVKWMIAVASGYLAILWLPITPEKIITVGISIALLRAIFPNDQKTLAVLKTMYVKARRSVKKLTRKKKKVNTNTIKTQVKVIKHKFTDTNLKGKKCPGGVIITTAEIVLDNQSKTIDFEDIGIRKEGEIVSGEYDLDNTEFVPDEIIAKRNEKKSRYSISDILGIVAICVFCIVFIVLIIMMCNKVKVSYYIFLGLIVVSSFAVGIGHLIAATRKKIKYQPKNIIEVDGEITSFLEEHCLKDDDSVRNSREITRNEDLQPLLYNADENPLYERGNISIHEKVLTRFFRPYYTYEYEGKSYKRPSLQRFLFDELQREDLYIGKKIKILINKNDKSIYVPVEKPNSLNIALGITFLVVGVIFGGLFVYLIKNIAFFVK